MLLFIALAAVPLVFWIVSIITTTAPAAREGPSQTVSLFEKMATYSLLFRLIVAIAGAVLYMQKQYLTITGRLATSRRPLLGTPKLALAVMPGHPESRRYTGAGIVPIRS